MFGDEENAAVENFTPAASDVAAAAVVKPEPVPGVDAPATPQPEVGPAAAEPHWTETLAETAAAAFGKPARFDSSADETGASVWEGGEVVAEFNVGALTKEQAIKFATDFCAHLNETMGPAPEPEAAQPEQPKTDAEIFAEHNQHDAEGNCIVASADRCGCSRCKRADGREKEV